MLTSHSALSCQLHVLSAIDLQATRVIVLSVVISSRKLVVAWETTAGGGK